MGERNATDVDPAPAASTSRTGLGERFVHLSRGGVELGGRGDGVKYGLDVAALLNAQRRYRV
jgi:hypothetical protein